MAKRQVRKRAPKGARGDYTRAQVAELLLAEFDAWMTGQTAGLGPDGEPRYYWSDVLKFTNMIGRLIASPGRGIVD